MMIGISAVAGSAFSRFSASNPSIRGIITSRSTRSGRDRKSTRLNSSHANISYAVFCFKKKNQQQHRPAQYQQPHYTSHYHHDERANTAASPSHAEHIDSQQSHSAAYVSVGLL